ncbi:XRE family transcriptional regulator [Paenibacillus agaridevorans]|uniref:XRE family transcriptional regulator n=1 Tax=Paenibacillus agaridevorans TaxID=171404 RepID=A0A2R5F0P7_9BACL|nr:XRE family transcriptional regulator [Paenibacillus agaridevorans]GBG11519.1 XRE family transcriptional regulator [Paenibacillus agaridevorans]
MEPIHKKVGKNLHAIRKSRGLSLDNVAEMTGVSKAMLGQIERGDSNPTISVLWRIVNGLGISFTTLIEEVDSDVTIATPGDLESFAEEEGAYRTFPLFPYRLRNKFESYLVVIEPGCEHVSEPHNDGVEEYLFVQQGVLELEHGDERYEVPAGSAVHFHANRPHTYRNHGEETAKFFAVIFYADAAARG